MSRTIELEEKDVVRRSFRIRLFLAAVKLAVVVGVFVTAAVYTADGWHFAKEYGKTQLTLAKYKVANYLDLVHYTTKIVPVNEAKIEELVTIYSSKYGVNPIVAWAVIDKESGLNPNRIRFEQGWKDDYGKSNPKPAWMNPIEYDLQFSSFGLMQVSYIIWKDFCSLTSYTDLLVPEKNIDCGLKIIRQCLEDNANISKNGQKLRTCFRKFNGAGPKAEQYANDAMSRIADYTIEDKPLLTVEPAIHIIRETSPVENIRTSIVETPEKYSNVGVKKVSLPQVVSERLNKIQKNPVKRSQYR